MSYVVPSHLMKTNEGREKMRVDEIERNGSRPPLLLRQDLLHPTSEHLTCLLLLVRLSKYNVLVVMPLLRQHLLSIGIFKAGLVLRPQEVCYRVTRLFLASATRWPDTVQARIEPLSRQETERLADVDDCVPRSWLNKSSSFCLWHHHL